MPDDPNKAPKAKHWCDQDRKTLTNLVRRGDVDIYDGTLENIEAVRREHWPHRDQKLFRNNFHTFAAAWAVEQEKAGSREVWGEPPGGKSARLYLLYSNMLADTPPPLVPSPLAKPQIAK
jgi:hypothetical protein